MSYSSETLGAFSFALGEVYSNGNDAGQIARPFPKSISALCPDATADPSDRAYLVALLHSHLLIPFSRDNTPNVGANDPNAIEKFLRLRAVGLTLRECEVAFWIAEGKRDGEIAIILGMAAKTVSKHVEHLLEKLGVESRCAAAGVVVDLLNR